MKPEVIGVNVHVLRLAGEITLHDVMNLKTMLAEYMKAGRPCVALDFTRVTHLHLSAVPVLVERAQRLREYGGDLKIFAMSSYLNRIADLAGLKPAILTYATENDVLHAFSYHAPILPATRRSA